MNSKGTPGPEHHKEVPHVSPLSQGGETERVESDRRYLYQSAAMKIGRREWHVVVYDVRGYLGASAFTDYEWRYPPFSNIEATRWESMKSYPTYNLNDGMYAGCPKTLRKLYDFNRTQIDAAMAKAEEAGL